MSNTDVDRDLKLRHLSRERLIEIIEDQRDELADNEEMIESLKKRLERTTKALQDRTAQMESDQVQQEIIGALSDQITKLSNTVEAQYAKHIADLEARCAELQAELDRQQIIRGQAGSIAEASLTIHRVFEETQKAADDYLESIKAQCVDTETIEREARQHAEQIVREAEEQARAMEAEAEERIAAREAELRRVYTEIQQSSESLRRIMG